MNFTLEREKGPEIQLCGLGISVLAKWVSRRERWGAEGHYKLRKAIQWRSDSKGQAAKSPCRARIRNHTLQPTQAHMTDQNNWWYKSQDLRNSQDLKPPTDVQPNCLCKDVTELGRWWEGLRLGGDRVAIWNRSLTHAPCSKINKEQWPHDYQMPTSCERLCQSLITKQKNGVGVAA